MSASKKIYLASSWKLLEYPTYLEYLRFNGYEVYDYRDPEYAFKWSAVGMGNHEDWDVDTFVRKVLKTKEAHRGFYRDFEALKWCDACVCLMPGGRSASWEAGWAAGAGKKSIIHYVRYDGPELMFKPANGATFAITTTIPELFVALKR